MSGGALGALVRHAVHRRICGPALGSGLAVAAVLRMLVEVRPAAVADGVHAAVLLLAMATVTAVVDPAGSIADATPTRRCPRRLLRAGGVLVVVCGGWAVALAVVPGAIRPPAASATVDLAVLCAVVMGAASMEVRSASRHADPVGAAVGVAMAWAALRLLQPPWSPFAPGDASRAWLPLVVAVAVLAFGVASADPARPRWRWLPSGRRPGR